MRALLPPTWRAEARAVLRAARDLARGEFLRLARRSRARALAGRRLAEQMAETQPIRKTELWQAKVENLRLAAARIGNVALGPGEIFSFWRLVGRPSRRRGFTSGRTILAGAMQSSPGGGLCQLSGILHALGLRAGLGIRERHAHSLDLYDESTRFAPLGSDATVAYGYKDLRLENRLPFAICFRFQVEEERIRAVLCAEGPVPEYQVEHRILERSPGVTLVETARTGPSGEREGLGLSRYGRPGSLESSSSAAALSRTSPATCPRKNRWRR